MKKLLIIICILFSLPFLLIGCLRLYGIVTNHTLHSQIFRFVDENEQELTAIAKGQMNGTNHDEFFLGVRIEGVYTGEHPIVQFYYDGTGLAPSSCYYGFYYSPDDAPAAYDNNTHWRAEQRGDSEWIYHDPAKGSDNGGRTIRITKYWFYYEAWF